MYTYLSHLDNNYRIFYKSNMNLLRWKFLASTWTSLIFHKVVVNLLLCSGLYHFCRKVLFLNFRFFRRFDRRRFSYSCGYYFLDSTFKGVNLFFQRDLNCNLEDTLFFCLDFLYFSCGRLLKEEIDEEETVDIDELTIFYPVLLEASNNTTSSDSDDEFLELDFENDIQYNNSTNKYISTCDGCASSLDDDWELVTNEFWLKDLNLKMRLRQVILLYFKFLKDRYSFIVHDWLAYWIWNSFFLMSRKLFNVQARYRFWQFITKNILFYFTVKLIRINRRLRKIVGKDYKFYTTFHYVLPKKRFLTTIRFINYCSNFYEYDFFYDRLGSLLNDIVECNRGSIFWEVHNKHQMSVLDSFLAKGKIQ